MGETETVFREWMHLFREWMRLFRECMRLFRGSKSAHKLSVHVRWESKDTPLGTNNQSQQPYHRLFDLKKVPDSVKTYPGYRSNRLGTVCDVIARWYSCRLYASRQAARWMKSASILHQKAHLWLVRIRFALWKHLYRASKSFVARSKFVAR